MITQEFIVFVVWMKIPTKHSEQNKNPISLKSNTHVISAFQFQYTNILGKMCPYTYEMSPEMEGTILFFLQNFFMKFIHFLIVMKTEFLFLATLL